jgi:TPP-dependent pyruvate/acetoin dehydrogenase alpha subunit
MAGELAARPRAMGIPTVTADGMDVADVHAAAVGAVARARAGEGPQFIESLTYRFVGHSRSDPGRYRKDGELDVWKGRDPLTVCRARLLDGLGVEERRVAEVEERVDAELQAAIESARQAPMPRPGGPAREFKPAA